MKSIERLAREAKETRLHVGQLLDKDSRTPEQRRELEAATEAMKAASQAYHDAVMLRSEEQMKRWAAEDAEYQRKREAEEAEYQRKQREAEFQAFRAKWEAEHPLTEAEEKQFAAERERAKKQGVAVTTDDLKMLGDYIKEQHETRGRKPLGDRAMTAAERQKAWRDRRRAEKQARKRGDAPVTSKIIDLTTSIEQAKRGDK